MQYSKSDGGVAPRYDEGEDMVRQLQANQTGVDDKLHQSQIQLFKDRQLITSGDQLDDQAPNGDAQGLDSDSDSEVGDSDSEGGESQDESDADSEEEEAGTEPSLKRMPQESIQVTVGAYMFPNFT